MWKLILLPLLLLLTVCVFVFPHSEAVVEYLPGLSGKFLFKFQTGYIGVGESEVFYHFIHLERNSDNDPLLPWLTGGPGCSGFSTLVYESGQANFDYANSDGPIPTFVVMLMVSLGHDDYQIVGVQSAGMFPANMNDYGGMHQGSGLASGYGDVRGLLGAGFEQQRPYNGQMYTNICSNRMIGPTKAELWEFLMRAMKMGNTSWREPIL